MSDDNHKKGSGNDDPIVRQCFNINLKQKYRSRSLMTIISKSNFALSREWFDSLMNYFGVGTGNQMVDEGKNLAKEKNLSKRKLPQDEKLMVCAIKKSRVQQMGAEQQELSQMDCQPYEPLRMDAEQQEPLQKDAEQRFLTKLRQELANTDSFCIHRF